MVKTDMELLKSMLIKKENLKTNNGFLKIENTTEGLNAKLKSIETQIMQEVRKGHNLIGFEDGSEILNGMTCTKSNGKIILNGTTTDTAKFFIPLLNKFTILQNEAVTMQAFNPIAYTGTAGDLRLRVVDTNSVEQIVFNVTNVNSILSAKASASADFEVAYLLIRIESGITLSNFELIPQLIEGTEEKEYEQYGAMPSLGFPSPVKHVGGDIYNIVNTNKNLFNKNIRDEVGNFYDIIGDIRPSDNWYIVNIKVKANTNYYLSGNKINNTTAHIVLLDKNKKYIKTIGTYIDTHLITTTNNTEYIGLSVPIYALSTDVDTIMLEENNMATYYFEHQYIERLLNLSKYNLYKAVICREGIDWYILENYAKYVVTGEENITGWATTNNSFIVEIADIIAPTYANTDIVELYSECQKATSRLAIYNATQNEDLVSISGSQVFFLSADYSTSADFKAAMIGKEIIYKMDKPIKTLITDEVLIKQLNSMILGIEEYEDITYLNCDNQLILELEVEKDKIKILEQENMNLNQIVLENGGI